MKPSSCFKDVLLPGRNERVVGRKEGSKKGWQEWKGGRKKGRRWRYRKRMEKREGSKGRG